MRDNIPVRAPFEESNGWPGVIPGSVRTFDLSTAEKLEQDPVVKAAWPDQALASGQQPEKVEMLP